MFGSAFQPLVHVGWQLAVFAQPVVALVGLGRVDHAGDVAGSAHHETPLAGQRLRAGVSAADGHDVVFARAIHVKRHVQLAQVDFFAAHGELAGFDEVVFQIGVAQIPGVEGAGQVRGVAVPVQQVKRGRRFALEVVAHHVIPDQIVRPQKAESAGQFLALEQAALAHLQFAELHGRLVDEHIQHARVAKVHQRGQQRDAGHGEGALAALGLGVPRRQHRQRRGQQRAAHAKAQRVDLFRARDVAHLLDGGDDGLLDVVVPRFLRQRFVGVAPAHHESAVSLCHGVAHEGVVGLQIQDVELVDARRHDEQRLFMHFFRQWFVFEQLEQLVFKHHGALGRGHVAAHFKLALVGHRHMALLNIAHHVRQALRQTLPLRLQRLLLRFGIEGQKVARRGRRNPLLGGKTQARLGFGVALGGIGQRHQRAGVEQVQRRRPGRHRVLLPGFALEAAVLDFRRRLQAAVPQRRGFLHVLVLQLAQFFRRKAQHRHGRRQRIGRVALLQ